MFAVSESAGKDVAGEPEGEHDLADVMRSLHPFLTREGFFVVASQPRRKART